VCTSICLFSLALSKNLLPHPSCVHWKSLSPWTVLCFFKLALSWKIFPQESSGHRKILGCWWDERPVGRRPSMPLGRFFSRVLLTSWLGFLAYLYSFDILSLDFDPIGLLLGILVWGNSLFSSEFPVNPWLQLYLEGNPKPKKYGLSSCSSIFSKL